MLRELTLSGRREDNQAKILCPSFISHMGTKFSAVPGITTTQTPPPPSERERLAFRDPLIGNPTIQDD